MPNPLDEVLTPKQQRQLLRALLDASQGSGFGWVGLDIHKGQVRRIWAGKSYSDDGMPEPSAAAAVFPLAGKRTRKR